MVKVWPIAINEIASALIHTLPLLLLKVWLGIGPGFLKSRKLLSLLIDLVEPREVFHVQVASFNCIVYLHAKVSSYCRHLYPISNLL